MDILKIPSDIVVPSSYKQADFWVRRRQALAHCTLGEFYVMGQYECYTLEDPMRDLDHGAAKVVGDTAIRCGIYPITIDMSVRFNRMMPHVWNVQDFDGIRLHSGNTDKDTLGCVLVGKDRGAEWIGRSRYAFSLLYPIIKQTLAIRPHNIGWIAVTYEPGELR
jgi:hypothetical protein